MLSILFDPKTQTLGALVYPDVSFRVRPCLPRLATMFSIGDDLVRGRFIFVFRPEFQRPASVASRRLLE
jgi:hypothetical protein